MKLSSIADSALVITLCSGLLYLLGFVHDSAELNVFGLPTSFVYPPETLLLKGFSVAMGVAIFIIPVVAAIWVVAVTLWRKVSSVAIAHPALMSGTKFFSLHRDWLFAIATVTVVTLLIDRASSEGNRHASRLVQERADRTTQIKFKDGTQIVAVPFRSDDMFVAIVNRSQVPTGQMQVMVRRRDDIAEIRTLQQAWAPPQGPTR